MATKRYFISHAGADKPLALDLKAALGGDAWVDLHEIDIGSILLQEISAGIEAATDFVLLWSAASAASKWVQFETHMAFIRFLEDSAIALRVVCLDVTPVPLHLRVFLQARGSTTASDIATALLATTPAPKPRRRFFNRNSEINLIEEALYDARVSALWVCGIPGSGKRSLAREALTRVTAGTGTVLTVPVTEGTAEPELNLKLAGDLGLEPCDENADLDTLTTEIRAQISAFVGSGGVAVFEDADHWLEDNGELGRLARLVIEATERRGDDLNRLVIFTSRRKPKLSPAEEEYIKALYLVGLQPQHAIPLLHAQNAEGTDEELAEVVRELDGHPLALEVIAPQLPMALGDLNDRRHEIATDLIDPGRVLPTTWLLLEILSLVDGSLNGEDLSEVLGLSAEEFTVAVSQASEYSLLRLGSSGTLGLHPLLRDYFLRSFRKNKKYAEHTGALAALLTRRLSSLSTEDPTYVDTLLATLKILGLAGRFEEGRRLRQGLIGTLYQTGRELFQERRWAEALIYLEESLTGDDDVDLPAKQLVMKSLASLGRMEEARRLGDELVRAHPTNPSVLRDRGRVEQIDRQWNEAILYYQRAIPLRRDASQLYADIAQALIRLEDWDGAAAAAKTAIDTGGDTPYALSLYSQALEAKGEFENAKDMMARAVRREPNNPRYRHRLGRIAAQLGNRALALQEFTKSVEIDPTFVDSWLSLASTQADSGDLPSAKRSLQSVESLPGVPRAVLLNVRAKVALAGGDLDDAQAAIESALKERRDSQNMALAVRILVFRGEGSRIPVGQARAQVRILAKELMDQGGLEMIVDLFQKFPLYFDGAAGGA